MKPVIRLEHIEKVFTDGKEDFEALRDVSLEVNAVSYTHLTLPTILRV